MTNNLKIIIFVRGELTFCEVFITNFSGVEWVHGLFLFSLVLGKM